MRLPTILLLLGALACAPASTSTDTAADEQSLRATIDGFDQALTSANDSVIASYYADSAEMLPPGMPAVNGRANIRAFWASVWPLKATLTLTTAAIEFTGDVAVAREAWTWSQPVTGGEMRDHGKALVIWRRTDGTWRITHDIWNSDVAPAEAAKIVRP